MNIFGENLSRKLLNQPKLLMHKLNIFKDLKNINLNLTWLEYGVLLDKLEVCYDLSAHIIQVQIVDMELQTRWIKP